MNSKVIRFYLSLQIEFYLEDPDLPNFQIRDRDRLSIISVTFHLPVNQRSDH